MTIRTAGRLADGREIFYFDRAPGRGPLAEDQRLDLAAVMPRSQVRWDPLLRDYAVIAAHRQDRTYRPPADLCPLCPSQPGRSTEVPEGDYEVVVFENRFPSLSLRAAEAVPVIDAAPFRSGPGVGRCEVVSFTSEHDRPFASLPLSQVATVVDAWADRTTALSEIAAVEYVFCFENRGTEIGVTLSHPHGQIYGYPFVPPRFERMADAFEDHRRLSGSCLQCDLLAAELAEGERIVVESEHWVAYVPFAARWPYEVRLVPRRHLPELPALSLPERADLAAVYQRVLRGFDRLFETPAPYIAGWQQAPVRRGRDAWHLAAEVLTIRRTDTKLKYLAGSESAAAVWINDVSPEDAAQRLRAVTGPVPR